MSVIFKVIFFFWALLYWAPVIEDFLGLMAILLSFVIILLIPNKSDRESKSFYIALSGTLLLSLLLSLLPKYEIQEGHIGFLLKDERFEKAFQKMMPDQMYLEASREFRERYKKGCDDSHAGCWHYIFPGRKKISGYTTFNTSSYLAPAKYSRITSRLDISGVAELQSGFLNSMSAQDGMFIIWKGDIDRWKLPYYVFYEINEQLIGDSICTSTFGYLGDLYFDDCISIEESHLGQKIHFISYADELEVSHQKNNPIKYFELLTIVLKFLIFLSVLFFLLGDKWDLFIKNKKFNLIFITGTIYALIIGGTKFIYPLLPGGQDGVLHLAFAQEMVRSLFEGDLYNFFQGRESVFYFMPGQRFFNAFSLLIFGHTLWANFLISIFHYWVITRWLKFLLPYKWYLISSFVYIVLPDTYGFYYILKLGWRNLAEVAGYSLFLFSSLNILKSYLNHESFKKSFSSLPILAISIIFRPNMIIAFTILIVFISIDLFLRKRKYSELIYPVIGLSPVFLCLIHNLFYAGKFILFTSASTIPETFPTPPSIYLDALLLDTDALGQVFNQLWDWSGKGLKLPFLLGHLYYVYLLVRDKSRHMLLGLFPLGFHVVLLFWLPFGRYSILAWTFSIMLTLRVVALYFEARAQRQL